MEILIVNRGFKELNPLSVGFEACKPGHSFGPAVREYYLLHYVKSGKGRFECSGETYNVKSGQVFLIKPGEITRYSADISDPWEYIWLGFNGTLAERFSALPHVLDADGGVFGDIITCQSYTNCREEFIAAKLFELYCSVFESIGKPRRDYVQRACDYITANYANEISVQSIADMLGIERTYFSKLFRQKMSKSVREYLVDTRLLKARSLLCDGFNVSETANMCGYRDVFNFSKMFKKKYGIPPRDCRKP